MSNKAEENHYKIGDIVDVCEYYAEGIPKCAYIGLITNLRSYNAGTLGQGSKHFIIYEILDLDHNVIKTAEEFAIMRRME